MSMAQLQCHYGRDYGKSPYDTDGNVDDPDSKTDFKMKTDLKKSNMQKQIFFVSSAFETLWGFMSITYLFDISYVLSREKYKWLLCFIQLVELVFHITLIFDNSCVADMTSACIWHNCAVFACVDLSNKSCSRVLLVVSLTLFCFSAGLESWLDLGLSYARWQRLSFPHDSEWQTHWVLIQLTLPLTVMGPTRVFCPAHTI